MSTANLTLSRGAWEGLDWFPEVGPAFGKERFVNERRTEESREKKNLEETRGNGAWGGVGLRGGLGSDLDIWRQFSLKTESN